MVIVSSRPGRFGEVSADAVVTVDDHLSCDTVVTQRVVFAQDPGVNVRDVGKDDVVLRIAAAVRVDLGDEYEVLHRHIGRAEVAVQSDDAATDAVGRYLAELEVSLLFGASIDADAAGHYDVAVEFLLLDVLPSVQAEVTPRGVLLADVLADVLRAEQLIEIDLDLRRADVAERSQWPILSGHYSSCWSDGPRDNNTRQ